MNEIVKKLQGKKTLITLGIMFVLGIIQGFDLWQVPDKYWLILSLLGFGFLKTGTIRIEKMVEELRDKLDKK